MMVLKKYQCSFIMAMTRLIFLCLFFSHHCCGWKRSTRLTRFEVALLQTRGGGSAGKVEEEDDDSIEDEQIEQPTSSEEDIVPKPSPRKKSTGSNKSRHASHLILQLVERSGLDEANIESFALRQLITQRSQDYLQDLLDASSSGGSTAAYAQGKDRIKLPDPTRLLHYLAPKIPAIKHSPNVALRIQSVRSDMDPGVACCVVGSLAHVCELYDKAVAAKRHENEQADSNNKKGRKSEPISLQIIKDRRFEQLVECIMCGVDVKKRKRDYMRQQLDHDLNAESIEEVLDEEVAQVDEGLSVRDCCRAAWGVAVLGAHQLGSLGGERVSDLLIALSLRIRELLLSRLQLLRQGDLFTSDAEPTADLTIEERMHPISEEIAEDAASAMWAFACVRVCTDMRFAPLFEVCCSILCQNPIELRKRAQQETEVINLDMGVGSNDAVERLARAEDESVKEADVTNATDHPTRDVHAGKGQPEISGDEAKDGLIDYLSPIEVTDVLWALAVHGSKRHDSSQGEIALSETATAFRDFAFDRLIEWLKEELGGLLFEKGTETVEEAHEMNLGETATIEVIDAASVISSERATIGGFAVENITIEDSQAGGGAHCVQVIDAAAIMASSKERGDSVEVETVELNDDGAISAEQYSNEYNVESSRKEVPSGRSRLQIFSPRDLCSIAWAVTELNDSLQSSITHYITEIFISLGPTSLQGLSATDLSNLSWAIAKSLNIEGSMVGPAVLVTKRIADSASSLEQNLFNEEDGTFRPSLFPRFHPHEVGRLIWSITRTLSFTGSNEGDSSSPVIEKLALAALLTAAENLAVFGSEDLARLTWGFLELSNPEDFSQFPQVPESLGTILSTIEASLLNWEGGMHSSKNADLSNTKESTWFSSFFGRARHLALDQRLDESTEEAEDDLAMMPPSRRKSSLPLIKDLPLDPSTLCKITCSFVRLRTGQAGIDSGETLGRVALRLLTSRTGRLLRECPMQDLVRLCEAIATSGTSLGRERISHFVRRLVHHLNGLPNGRAFAISPQDTATLLWSLGELGVKYHPVKEDVAMAYRRLQLVTEIPLVSTDQLQHQLSDESFSKTLRGLVSTHIALHKKRYTVDCLGVFETRIPSIESPSCVCDVVETISKLRSLLVDESESEAATKTAAPPLETNETAKNADGDEELPTTSAIPDNQERIESVLCAACERLLSSLELHSMKMTSLMSSTELRRLMTVYSLSSLRADELVEEIEKEVEKRLEKLKSLVRSRPAIQGRLLQATSQAENLRSTLRGDTDSRFASFRSGLRSFFRGDRDEHVQDENDEDAVAETKALEEVEETLRSIIDVGEDAKELATASRPSLDTIVQGIEQCALFELGRCRELIAHYRRIDFDAGGQRGNRYDLEKRIGMAKRVLSRLLP